ncbi:hypothetical protein A0256_13690 [Mucilaginibacter sp. PAMC 26640]|nr:hypothetical protein A0256_13690 [Mucilaginibacter sp. PAMC 26640]
MYLEKFISPLIGLASGALGYFGSLWMDKEFLKSPKLISIISLNDKTSLYAGGAVAKSTFQAEVLISNHSKNNAYGLKVLELNMPADYSQILLNQVKINVPITESSPITIKLDVDIPKPLVVNSQLQYSLKAEYFNELNKRYETNFCGKINIIKGRNILIGWGKPPKGPNY